MIGDQELLRLAEAANQPTKWYLAKELLRAVAPKDAAFVSAASPATVIGILDRLEAAERAVAEAAKPGWIGLLLVAGSELVGELTPCGNGFDWSVLFSASGWEPTRAQAAAACEAAYRASKENR